MGTVYRKTVTKPLPQGAETITRSGERLARWKDAKGKTRTAPLTTGKDGSERIVILARTFTAKYRDGSGQVQEVATGCRDEAAARNILSELVKRAERVRSGLVSAGEDAVVDHLAGPFAQHLEDYQLYLEALDTSPAYRANTKRQIQRVAAACGFKRLAEVNAAAVEKWLAQQTREKNLSARTRNSYRADVVGFCNWCVEHGRLTTNPLAKLPKADERSDQRRKRRALNEEELGRLLVVARLRPLAEYGRASVRTEKPADKRKRSGWTYAPLTLDTLDAATAEAKDRLKKQPAFIKHLERLGWERALIYKTLVLTGLRKGELASLTVGQLHLDGQHPYAELHAADEKNRQGSQIPLRGDLAADLAAWLLAKRNAVHKGRKAATGQDGLLPITAGTTLPAHTPVFDVPAGLIRILNRDLEAAQIAKQDEQGRTVDVHALRHSFGTLLSKGGVMPRTAQAAMRHASIDLTMNVYTDPRLLDLHGAVNALPELPLEGSIGSPAALRATGTDAAGLGEFAPKFAPTADNRCKPGTTADKGDAPAVIRALACQDAVSASGVGENGLSESTCDKPKKGWLRGLEPPTSRSTVWTSRP